MSVAVLSLGVLIILLGISAVSHWMFPEGDHPHGCNCTTCFRRNLRHGGTL